MSDLSNTAYYPRGLLVFCCLLAAACTPNRPGPFTPQETVAVFESEAPRDALWDDLQSKAEECWATPRPFFGGRHVVIQEAFIGARDAIQAARQEPRLPLAFPIVSMAIGRFPGGGSEVEVLVAPDVELKDRERFVEEISGWLAGGDECLTRKQS